MLNAKGSCMSHTSRSVAKGAGGTGQLPGGGTSGTSQMRFPLHTGVTPHGAHGLHSPQGSNSTHQDRGVPAGPGQSRCMQGPQCLSTAHWDRQSVYVAFQCSQCAMHWQTAARRRGGRPRTSNRSVAMRGLHGTVRRMNRHLIVHRRGVASARRLLLWALSLKFDRLNPKFVTCTA